MTREMLRLMKPRTVVMDLSIDMGGCFETSRPTTFPSPTYEVDGILHMCVPNLPVGGGPHRDPGASPTPTLPYLQTIADEGIDDALCVRTPTWPGGVLLYRGRCASEALARSFGVEWEPPARGSRSSGGLDGDLPAAGHDAPRTR